MISRRQRFGGLYVGVVDSITPPTSVQNRSKSEYEYDVVITIENFTQIPIRHARRMDVSGGPDSFNDETIDVGQKVYIMFLQGMMTHPIIIGMYRQHSVPISESNGRHKSERFNKIVESVDQNGNYSVISDSGPNCHIKTTEIMIDDSSGESIKLDKQAKKMTINANEWELNVTGNVKIVVQKNAEITVNGDVKATVKKKLNVTAKDVNVKATGECKVKASKTVSVDGLIIKLNGSDGDILTNKTQSACYISGIPFIGTPKVKAG